jgi:hypothetical protein
VYLKEDFRKTWAQQLLVAFNDASSARQSFVRPISAVIIFKTIFIVVSLIGLLNLNAFAQEAKTPSSQVRDQKHQERTQDILRVRLHRAAIPKKRIMALSLRNTGFTLMETSEEDPSLPLQAVVQLQGKLASHNVSLLLNDRIVQIDRHGSFREKVIIKEEESIIHFAAIDLKGGIQHEEIMVHVDNWRAYSKKRREVTLAAAFKKAPVQLSFGIAYSLIQFDDSRGPNFQQSALTAKFSYGKATPSQRWDLGISTFLTLVPLHSSTIYSARFLGINGRIGYALPWIRDPWRLTLMTGVYYTTMLPSESDASSEFGYQSMVGPQVYPVVRRKFQNGTSLSAYFKYSPIKAPDSVISFLGRELAIGGAFSFLVGKDHTLSTTLDLSSYGFEIEGVTIRSNSASVGIGFGF